MDIDDIVRDHRIIVRARPNGTPGNAQCYIETSPPSWATANNDVYKALVQGAITAALGVANSTHSEVLLSFTINTPRSYTRKSE